MGESQLAQIAVGPWSELRHHLSGTEGAKTTAGLNALATTVGVQETGGVEVAGTCGVHQLTKAERLHRVGAGAIEDQ